MAQHTLPILIVMTGHVLEHVRLEYGDFDQQFSSLLPVSTRVYAICEEWPRVPLPNPHNFSGVIFSGSASMLDEKKPWMFAALDLIRQTIRANTPLLCICFGHQLLGFACGAKVGPNPKGRFCGTTQVTLKAVQDPLFAGLPSQFPIQISHRDVLLRPSPQFETLGEAAHDPLHIIKAGQLAWGVQFHPEWTPQITQGYLQARRSVLEKEWGITRFEQELSQLEPSKEAQSLFERFARICIQQAAIAQT